MTLEELKRFVGAENRIQVLWVTPQARIQPFATVVLQVPFPAGTPGKYQQFDCVVLDETYNADTLLGVYFHELGHRDYAAGTARRFWSDLDAEVHAHRFALSELMRCGFHDQLQRYMRNVDHWTAAPNAEAEKQLRDTVTRLKASSEWLKALGLRH